MPLLCRINYKIPLLNAQRQAKLQAANHLKGFEAVSCALWFESRCAYPNSVWGSNGMQQDDNHVAQQFPFARRICLEVGVANGNPSLLHIRPFNPAKLG